MNRDIPIDTCVQSTITENLEPTTNKIVATLKGAISNELHQRIDKLTRIINKASAESKQHPKDKTRAAYLQLAMGKHAKAMAEAYAQFHHDKHENPKHVDNEFCETLVDLVFTHGAGKQNNS